jgi:excisionase family DNA binding protein
MKAAAAKRPKEEWWSVKDAAEHLGVTEHWVYRHAAAGELPGYKMGKLWRFDPAAIRAWYLEIQSPLRGRV